MIPASGPFVVTTDALVEGVHFTRRTFDFSQIGHKAMAVNLSDLAAMGAQPSWALCALQLPDDLTVKNLRELSAGMAALSAIHGVSLVGGNVSRGVQLSLTVTLAGAIPKGRRPLTRSGARPGHHLYVSGPLGSASAGLEVLQRARPDGTRRRTYSKAFDALVQAQRTPAPHVRWGLEAARFASAGIDVSDGLVQDLGHLCEASGVGAELKTGLLPVLEALLLFAETEAHVHRHALTGGEDYVLLVSVPPSRVAAFEQRMAELGQGAFPIGVVTRSRGVRVDGKRFDGAGGFQHF